jgi:hypothetical protein
MRRTQLLACAPAILALLAALSAHAEPGPLLAQAGPMGILKVECNVEGAEVLVDGNPVGVTPLMTAVAAGDHQLEVRMDGYSRHSQELNVPADKKVLVQTELEYIAGNIIVMAEPAGATVSLDGTEVGTSPAVLLENVHPGKHTVTIAKAGYRTATENVSLAKGQELTLNVALEATAGLLLVTTVPAGASVYADGGLLGATPLEKADMSIGLHTLRLSTPAYADAFVTVDVVLGDEAAVEHVFSTEIGALKILPDPDDASVTVDSYPVGTGRQKLESIEPGVHKVVVTATDFLDYSEDVLVHKGRTQTVRANLQPTALTDGTSTTGGGIRTGDAKKKAPVIVAIVGAVATGTVIAIAAATTPGDEPQAPYTDYVFQLP